MFLIYYTLNYGSFKGKKSLYCTIVFPICFQAKQDVSKLNFSNV